MLSSDLVVGATGLVGSQLVETLLSRGRNVRVLARRELQPRLTFAGQLDARTINFETMHAEAEADDASTSSSYTLFQSIRNVYCCLGTTMKQAGSKQSFRRVDHDYVLATARLAKRAGVQQFHLVSAVGANPDSSVFYSRTKGETEQALRALQLQSLIIYRPSLLLGDRTELRTAERLGAGFAKAVAWSMRGPLQRYRAISARTVARAMANAADSGTFDMGTTVLESNEVATLGA